MNSIMRIVRYICRYNKWTWLIILTFFTLVTRYLNTSAYMELNQMRHYEAENVSSEMMHATIVKNYMKNRQTWKLSKLGTMMYKENDNFSAPLGRNFKVLNWGVGRHVLSLTGQKIDDPLEQCSVNNCKFIYRDDALTTADAVIFNLIHSNKPPDSALKKRSPEQRFIFYTDASPLLTDNTMRRSWKNMSGFFNWSMTYRTESDIPVPFGRVLPLNRPYPRNTAILKMLIPNWNVKRRDRLAAILVTNCKKGYKRRTFLKKLQKDVKIDIMGKCSKDITMREICPGSTTEDCPALNHYLFYLSIESAGCLQYMTEHVFYHAYAKGAIPIIVGPDKESVVNLLPPDSYIYADDVYDKGAGKAMSLLAAMITNLTKYEHELLKYHKWRLNFRVVNEHGYFHTRSYLYCRVCQALNYNDPSEKVYSERMLQEFLDSDKLCLDHYRIFV